MAQIELLLKLARVGKELFHDVKNATFCEGKQPM